MLVASIGEAVKSPSQRRHWQRSSSISPLLGESRKQRSAVWTETEALAVEGILRLVQDGGATWVSIRALEIEIALNPDLERRADVLALLAFAQEIVALRARWFQQFGLG
ncbi:MAG: hypothetical protein HY820_31200 [Acidobacteria bacterium]|nr:hypothetical protein [Acidobacteriota bacterium]